MIDTGSVRETGFVEEFGRSVARYRDEVAVASTRGRVSFGELDAWSGAIARTLEETLGPGREPVAVLAENDEWAVASFVAVAKVGRPAVILDATTPPARMASICETGRPVATLVVSELTSTGRQLGPAAGQLIKVPAPARFDGAQHRAVLRDTMPDCPLSIIFTSGSTGRPKGVTIGSVAFTQASLQWDAMGEGAGERIGCPIPLSFAYGQQVLVRALITGGELHTYDPRRAGIGGVAGWIDDQRLTVLASTPHLVRAAFGSLPPQHAFRSLRCVTLGGETVLASDVMMVREATDPGCVVISQLGSSEAWVMARLRIDGDYALPANGTLSVGEPAPGREIQLLDEHGAAVTTAGEPGYITVTGDHLAAGYWEDEVATAEHFIRAGNGRRVFTSADLGRWNERGELEYIGRADNMVKIRGYRVEPAEVEFHLRARGEVRDCVVVGDAADRDEPRLIAYVVPEPTVWLSASLTRRRLADELPAYMVPVQFVELEALPRNPNGKVDRAALPPAPNLAPGREPKHGVELLVATICIQALGLAEIGAEDDIFMLGADSLAVEEIAAALEDQLDITVTSASVIQRPTVAQLAALPRGETADLIAGVGVPLRRGTGAPIFVVAGGGGVGLELYALAKELDTHRPVYAFQADGVERGRPRDFSIRAMARRYERVIRALQPVGPYALLGYSFGGVVAIELARRFRARGDVISYLGLVDPADPDAAMPELRNMAPEAQQGSWLGRSRQRFRMRYPHLTRGYYRDMRGQVRYRVMADLADRALRRYRPPTVPIDDVAPYVYLAEDTGVGVLGEWFVGVAGVSKVGGDHLTIVRPPYVQHLAELVSAQLDEDTRRRVGGLDAVQASGRSAERSVLR